LATGEAALPPNQILAFVFISRILDNGAPRHLSVIFGIELLDAQYSNSFLAIIPFWQPSFSR
jgi:hypothetical protein